MSRKTRKLMWSVPLIAAVAVIGALAAFMTLTPNQAAAQTEEEVPGTPTMLKADALSPTSIELTWDPPMASDGGGVDAYRIDYSEDGMVWYALESSYDSATYTDDFELSAREKRYYRVFAYNSSGSSDVSGPVYTSTEATDKPDAPTDLELALPEARTALTDPAPQEQINLTWEAPENPEGAPVTSYRIQTSRNGRSYTTLETISAKDATCNTAADRDCEYFHKGLQENTERFYRVYAINAEGESPASGSPSLTTAEAIIPGAPADLRVGLNRAGRIWLYWDAPVDDTGATAGLNEADPAGAPILGYYIQGARGADEAAAEALLTDTPDPDDLYYVGANTDVIVTATIQGQLQGGTGDFWAFEVAAVNRVVNRNLEDGVVAADEMNFIDAVGFNATADDTPTVAHDDLVGQPTLKAKRNSNVNGGRTSIILEWDVDGGLTDDEVTALQAETPNAAPGSTATTYRLETSKDRVDWTPVDLDPDTAGVQATTTAKMFTHMGLTAGTTYHYRVFARHGNMTGEGADRALTATEVSSPASALRSVTTANAEMPWAPVLNTAEAQSETEIALTWTPPNDPDDDTTTPAVPAGQDGSEPVGYGKIAGYMVESSPDGTNWSDLVRVGPKSDTTVYSYNDDTGKLTTKSTGGTAGVVNFEHTELSQAQTVYYRITTINNAPRSQAYSNPSNAMSATTEGSLSSDDPGGLIAKARSYSSIMLMWNARADDIVAAPVTGYKIESSPLNAAGDDCAENWSTLVEDTESTTTSYTHMGLMPETGMCYRVFGINIVDVSTSFVGYGDAYITTNDNDAIAMTDAAMAPGMPTGVTASATSDTEITVRWTEPTETGGADITGYTVEYMMTGGTAMTMDVTGVSASLSGLTPETAYSIRVHATNSVGDSDWTAAVTATTRATVPPDTTLTAPTNVLANGTTTAGEIEVTWTAGANALGHVIVVLDNADNFAVETVETPTAGGQHTITGVPAGTYTVVVVSFKSTTDYEYDSSGGAADSVDTAVVN